VLNYYEILNLNQTESKHTAHQIYLPVIPKHNLIAFMSVPILIANLKTFEG
jgi:hypothetical protein